MIFNNYGLNSVSDKTTTQATLHSYFIEDNMEYAKRISKEFMRRL